HTSPQASPRALLHLISPVLTILSPTSRLTSSSFFFFTNTAPTEIYTLSLHDALPIYLADALTDELLLERLGVELLHAPGGLLGRSEEHTSELQSRGHLVCRLLLEKKK